MKKLAAPPTRAQVALTWLKRVRAKSAFGVMVWRALDQSSSGLAEISRQNARSLATRSAGSFPAIMAELMAPIETPATQSG